MPSYARQKSLWSRAMHWWEGLLRQLPLYLHKVLIHITFSFQKDYHVVDIKTGLQLNKYSDDKELSTHQDWYIM